MNCDILKIVSGNDFSTQMTITALDAAGNVIENFSLEESTEVVVKYTLAGISHTIEAYNYNIEGNDITIQWLDLALGKYGFEIEGKFNGYSWRSAARFIFQIVADNASANIPDGVLVNGIYILNDWLRLLSGTGGGIMQVQADWTETDTNSPAYIQNKPDLELKADKVSGAVVGDFAALDANGNLTDSGKKASDFATAEQGAKADTAIQDISGKQDVLVSGTNIKTINNESILGSGNIDVGGAVESVNGKTGVVVLDAEDVGAYEFHPSGIPATDLESNVQSTLNQVSTNTTDIETLQAAYRGLTQSNIVLGPLPIYGVANTIYRVAGTDSYSDYMWNGEEFIKLAEYDGGLLSCLNDDSSANLNITDENGYVIGQFKDGHFKTKYFDSSLFVDYGMDGYTYIGEKINVKTYNYKYELLFTESKSSASTNQGSASYGKYLFQCHDTNDTIDVFNLETKTLAQTIYLTAVSTYHSNNANFGNEFYSGTDMFPLLYISQEKETEHKCLVYRISGTEGQWVATLVQTITFPVPSDSFLWYPNALIDNQNNNLIISGQKNTPWTTGSDNIICYKVFDLPKLEDGDVTLDVADIKNSVVLYDLPVYQGGFAMNNKVYMVFGHHPNSQLIVTDLDSKRIVSRVEIYKSTIWNEPEGCFVFDNTICVNFIDGKVYKFNF